MNGSKPADRSLRAHSLAELYLYLMVTPCPNCGRGPLAGDPAQSPAGGPTGRLAVASTCKSCKHTFDLEFDLPADSVPNPDASLHSANAVINPTDEPSAMIDVAGWMTLFRTITQAATDTADKAQARHLGLEAAQCLEEALKFYAYDNDLPPVEAFFSEASRQLLRDHPHRFARSRLVDLRSKLPTLDAMQKSLTAGDKARQPWWKVWN